MINLGRILKSRDITLLTKVHIVKAMVFPVVMYGCGSWTIKKAEHQKIGAFELWCWRRLLRVPWTTRRSNQSILKEFNPKYSLEGLMMKLKLQYFGHLMLRVDSLEKTPILGKSKGKRRGCRRWGSWIASLTQWTWVWANSRRQWRTGKPAVLQSMGSQRVGYILVTKPQQTFQFLLLWFVFWKISVFLMVSSQWHYWHSWPHHSLELRNVQQCPWLDGYSSVPTHAAQPSFQTLWLCNSFGAEIDTSWAALIYSRVANFFFAFLLWLSYI